MLMPDPGADGEGRGGGGEPRRGADGIDLLMILREGESEPRSAHVPLNKLPPFYSIARPLQRTYAFVNTPSSRSSTEYQKGARLRSSEHRAGQFTRVSTLEFFDERLNRTTCDQAVFADWRQAAQSNADRGLVGLG